MRFLPTRRAARVAVAAAAVAISALSLSACSSGKSASGSDASASASYGDLTLQLSWIKNEEFAGEFFADSKGYYTEAGFSKVNLVPGPTTGAAELLSGSADVALSDAVSIGTVVAAEGAPLKIIGATYQKNPFTVLSLAKGGNIKSPKDMIGKKIGVQDSNKSLFMALLKANQIDPSQLTIVPVQYDPAPLVNGEVDGFIAYLTNEAITVAAQGLATTNMPFADNGLPFVAETLTTTDKAISEKRAALKAFLVAEIRGWTDAVKDPAGGAKLAVDVYGKDLGLNLTNSIAGSTEASEKLIVSSDTKTNGLFWISDALQGSTIASLAGASITVKASDLFDLSLLQEVYKENPSLVNYAG